MVKREEVLDNIFDLLMEYFDGDKAKVHLWLEAPNPLLGNINPHYMIKIGREEKLLKFIKGALDEQN